MTISSGGTETRRGGQHAICDSVAINSTLLPTHDDVPLLSISQLSTPPSTSPLPSPCFNAMLLGLNHWKSFRWEVAFVFREPRDSKVRDPSFFQPLHSHHSPWAFTPALSSALDPPFSAPPCPLIHCPCFDLCHPSKERSLAFPLHHPHSVLPGTPLCSQTKTSVV